MQNSDTVLIGPFTEVLPMTGLPASGPIADEQMPIIRDVGILLRDGLVLKVGKYQELQGLADREENFDTPLVALPSFVDAHTHICFAGSRERDYAGRINGTSYEEIAARGGGILDTLSHTR